MEKFIAKIDGVKILNCTPHHVRFQDRSDNIVVVPPCGLTLFAEPVEREVSMDERIQTVTTYFSGSETGASELKQAKESGADVIIGSIISAQAYGEDVKSLVPVPGFERKPPAEKLFSARKFNVFPRLEQMAKDLNIF